MYGTRTKKVTAYGRRGQRYVPVSETLLSIRQVEAKTTDRAIDIPATENIVPVAEVARRKQESLKAAVDTSPECHVVGKGPRIVSSPKTNGVQESVARRPLASYPRNVPGSPAFAVKNRKKAALGLGKGTPGRLFAPFVDMDIIVLDDEGRRLSQERRVSKPDVQANLLGVSDRKLGPTKRHLKPKHAVKAIISSPEKSDEEYIPAHVTSRPKKKASNIVSRSLKHRARRIVFSSSSSSEDEDVTPRQRGSSPSPIAKIAKKTGIPSAASGRGVDTKAIKTDELRDQHERTIVSPPQPQAPGHKKVKSRIEESHSSETAPKPKDTKRNSFCHEVEVVIPISSHTRQSSHEEVSIMDEAATHTWVIPATTAASVVGDDRLTTKVEDVLKPSQLDVKPRQTTPIKLKKGFTFGNRPDITPPILTPGDFEDFDTSLDFIGDEFDSLSLQSNNRKSEESMDPSITPTTSPLRPSHTKPNIPTYVQPLLHECNQLVPHEFSKFIEGFPHDPKNTAFLSWSSELDEATLQFRKIGEASYSEVFGVGDVVLKVIPLRDEVNSPQYGTCDDSPFTSDTKDVVKEIIVTRAMGEICAGFVKLLSTHVVRGRYPPHLLALWDEYNERKGSEGVRPDMFTDSQIYAIIVLPNGGPDLEAFSFTKPSSKFAWRQACSVFWQVTKSLATAEELVRFEHRDLHWGQILVKDTGADTSLRKKTAAVDSLMMNDPSHGVRATIIDLGLARIDRRESGRDNTYWTPFDATIFEGEGDYQFDVYRMMREHNGDLWQEYNPMSNVLWLHYLSTKLLHAKRIRAPANTSGRKSLTAAIAAAHALERQSYDCLVHMEEALKQAITDALPVSKKTLKGLKGRRKTQAVTTALLAEIPFASAGEVWEYGRMQGWVT